MSPNVYRSLKAQLLSRIQPLYELVAVPREAPEKVDYGDIDLVVAYPRAGLTHQMVTEALRATCSVPPDGGRVTNFALAAIAFQLGDKDVSAKNGAAQVFYQVDINVMADKAEWEDQMFTSSYGDVGLILGQMTRTIGLSFGVHGLKFADPLPTRPPIAFHICNTLSPILAYFGLSMDRWAIGFSSQLEIFDWLATSTLFDPCAIVNHHEKLSTVDNSKERGRKARAMFQNFVLYARERAENKIRRQVDEVFSGSLVQEWTGVRSVPVRWVMDGVRERLTARYTKQHLDDNRGQDDIGNLDLNRELQDERERKMACIASWELVLSTMSLDDVRAEVVEVKDEMEVAGKLIYDWRAAKAEKAEKRRAVEQSMKDLNSDMTALSVKDD
ncbi:predicted protein [Sparassis crispa]|uniref:Uncharacterized protein n=1 Tax=Sparassis crispa TaxID=139825 RepID=A0A401GRQ7_9APHY|nr:predicted protein [Sparassis crispa]GBE84907.1 predicted protein [Sparassis crispa]